MENKEIEENIEDFDEFTEYYPNSNNIFFKIIYAKENKKLNNKGWIKVYTYYDEHTQNVKHHSIIEDIDDENNVYTIDIYYLENGKASRTEYRKNGLLHKNNENYPSQIVYFDNDENEITQPKTLSWYTNGCLYQTECYNFSNKNINWWEYEFPRDKASVIEYKCDGTVISRTYYTNKFVCIVESYDITNMDRYIIKIKDDEIYSKLIDEDGAIISESWTNKCGKYHCSVKNHPSFIIYFANGNKMIEEYYIDGGLMREDYNLPISVEYYENGKIYKEIYNIEEKLLEQYVVIYYDNFHHKDIKSEMWMKYNKHHRDENKPAIIEYYPLKIENDEKIKVVKKEEYWKNGLAYRDDLLFTKIRYGQNGSIINTQWIVVDENVSYIQDIISLYDIFNILVILDITYQHATIGHPKIGFMNYICEKFNFNKNVLEYYERDIKNYINKNFKKYDEHFNCISEILFLPPLFDLNNKIYFKGGQEFKNIKREFIKFSLNM